MTLSVFVDAVYVVTFLWFGLAILRGADVVIGWARAIRARERQA